MNGNSKINLGARYPMRHGKRGKNLQLTWGRGQRILVVSQWSFLDLPEGAAIFLQYPFISSWLTVNFLIFSFILCWRRLIPLCSPLKTMWSILNPSPTPPTRQKNWLVPQYNSKILRSLELVVLLLSTQEAARAQKKCGEKHETYGAP